MEWDVKNYFFLSTFYIKVIFKILDHFRLHSYFFFPFFSLLGFNAIYLMRKNIFQSYLKKLHFKCSQFKLFLSHRIICRSEMNFRTALWSLFGNFKRLFDIFSECLKEIFHYVISKNIHNKQLIKIVLYFTSLTKRAVFLV